MKPMNRCLICGRSHMEVSAASLAPFVAHRCSITPVASLRLLYCCRCDFSFFNYRFEQTEIARLYSGYREEEYNAERLHFEPYYAAMEALYEDRNNSFHRNRIEDARGFFAPFQKKFRSVLDYGGETDGWLAKGIFANSEILSYDISVEGTQPIPRSYDAVICCNVLEHVSDPIPFLNELRRFLKPDGLLYIEVPLEMSSSLMHEHISFFTPRSVAKAMHRAGFQTLKVKTSSLETGASIGVLAKFALWKAGPRVTETLRLVRFPSAHRWPARVEGERHPFITTAVIEKISARSEAWIKAASRVVVAPASNFNSQLIAESKLKETNIVGFCDKSEALQRKSFNGIPVFPYKSIPDLKPNVVFVSSPFWEEEIYRSVEAYRSLGIEIVRSLDILAEMQKTL